MEKIIVGSTNLIELTGLKDRLTSTYPIDAAVQANLLLASDESAVTGGSALTVSYEAGTSGKTSKYYGAIPYNANVVAEIEYILRVVATWNNGIGNVVRRFDIACIGAVR